MGASRVVLAVPIGPDDIVARFPGYADEVVCLQTPAFFFAVGQGYRNFTQTSDDEVIALLDRARRNFAEAAAIDAAADPPLRDEEVRVLAGPVSVAGHLTIPENPRGIVVFAHGSGSSRHSPRNRYVAERLEPGRARHAAVRLAHPGRRTQPRQRLRHRRAGRPADRRHRLAG